MIWRPATNPEIRFEIDTEGNVLGCLISPKFQNVLEINEMTNVQELYEQMVDINSKITEEDYV